jgi:hypothetical protein
MILYTFIYTDNRSQAQLARVKLIPSKTVIVSNENGDNLKYDLVGFAFMPSANHYAAVVRYNDKFYTHDSGSGDKWGTRDPLRRPFGCIRCLLYSRREGS